MTCNWAYEINLPLECFLNSTQPDLGHWYEPSWLWLGPALFLAAGFILDWWKGRTK